jgi:sulfatase modifying factor 1
MFGSQVKATRLLVPNVVEVPGGEFWMGCDQGRADEQPVHRVWVDGYAMGVTTVTNREYQLFVQETSRNMPEAFQQEAFCQPLQPVVAVSWFDCMAYCQWLTQNTGQFFRLPTEAEWEWAIRCGRDNSLYAWGDESPASFEFYRSGWLDERPHAVGLRTPNAFGLHDLGDNVHEWCLDWYDPDFYWKSQYTNPLNMDPSPRRSSRGGSWRHRIKVSRCAARSSLPPQLGYTDYGFRVVRVVRR